jgi:enoyl-CoA hydratase
LKDPEHPPAVSREPLAGRIRISRDGATVTVVLDRPERHNALDRSMWERLVEVFRALAADDTVRCIVLTGAGGSFSPGADIAEFGTERTDVEGARAYGSLMDRAYDAIRSCPAPVIAAIDGPCTGAGLVLALLCDLRFATARSVFGAPVSRLGLAMPHSEFATLWHAAGPAKTLELLLEARVIPAREAAAAGIINRVADDGALDSMVGQCLERILSGAPLVHQWHKQFSRRMAAGGPWAENEIAESYASFATEDYREGYRSFLEKRPPVFRGR